MKELVKLIVYVPETHAEAVRNVLGNVGAGKIGNYSYCSFSSKGTGRFKPENGANPTIGQIGKLEEVAEEKIEVACYKEQIRKIIEAIKQVHPYEEVAIDIYPMLIID